MNKSLIIDNNVGEQQLDIITNYFENYKIGNSLSIEYNEAYKCAILKLDFWYDNSCAKNMYNKIEETGETRIVYDDPEYFTVRFYPGEVDTFDDRDEYIANENLIDYDSYDEDSLDCREEYIANENLSEENGDYKDVNHKPVDEDFVNEYEEDVSGEDESREDEGSEYSDDYLEDDVIDNSNNIDRLFELITELTKNVKSIESRLGNISKKTNILYKNRSVAVKRSVWEGRLRSR